MKKITFILLLSLVTVLSAEAHRYRHSNAAVISIQTFYNELSPYGDWIYTSENGYVWRPYFEYYDAFRPYSSGGNWAYTEYGWTWVSDYNWGWATFHYGRWDYDAYLGWLWIPGYEWAPAWVSWGYYDNYYGWAPLGPNVYVNVSTNWYAPDPWWTFVPRHHFCSGDWNNYIYDRPVRVKHITHITNVYINDADHNRNSWYHGPRVNEVERYSRHKVKRYEVVDSERRENTGIRSERLNVYRPVVDSKRTATRPENYRKADEARNERKVTQTNARSNNPGANTIRRTQEDRRSTTVSERRPESYETRRTNISARPTETSPRTAPASETRTTRTTQASERKSTPVRTDVRDQNRNSTSGSTRNNATTNRTETRENTYRPAESSTNENSRSSAARSEVKAKPVTERRSAATPATQPQTERQSRNTTAAAKSDNRERPATAESGSKEEKRTSTSRQSERSGSTGGRR